MANHSEYAQNSGKRNEAVPYRRETFNTKELLIDFDANFVRTDESFLQNKYMGKDLERLQLSIDSMGARLDSIKTVNATQSSINLTKKPFKNRRGRYVRKGLKKHLKILGDHPAKTQVLDFDSLLLAEPPSSQAAILGRSRRQSIIPNQSIISNRTVWQTSRTA
jgi:lipopolysaccharide export system permease protein